MKIIEHVFKSTCLNCETAISIVVPSIEKSQYPVLWITGPGDHKRWMQNSNIAQYVNDAGIVLVVIDSSKTWGGQNLKAENFFFEDYLTVELPNVVNEIVPISRESKLNFIAGYSKGSYIALREALLHPELYSYVAAISGGSVDPYCLYYDIGGANPGLLERMFGMKTPEEFDMSDFNMENLVFRLSNEGKALPIMHFYCGNSDPAARCVNVRLHMKMNSWGIKHYFELSDGGHDWKNADYSINKTITYIKDTLLK